MQLGLYCCWGLYSDFLVSFRQSTGNTWLTSFTRSLPLRAARSKLCLRRCSYFLLPWFSLFPIAFWRDGFASTVLPTTLGPCHWWRMQYPLCSDGNDWSPQCGLYWASSGQRLQPFLCGDAPGLRTIIPLLSIIGPKYLQAWWQVPLVVENILSPRYRWTIHQNRLWLTTSNHYGVTIFYSTLLVVMILIFT